MKTWYVEVGAILVALFICVNLFAGNPFAARYTASVVTIDKDIGHYGMRYATIELQHDLENGWKKGDRKNLTVNGADDYAQLEVGKNSDVQIRGGHIIYAYLDKE